MLASRLHHPDVLAISSAGSSCRSDLYCDFHGQMIRRGPEPCALQRDRLARVMRDRDADEVLISHNAARWIEVYLGGRWHTFDPRNNAPRVGRVLIAQGRDAADVPLTHTFGPGTLSGFRVWADEVPPE